MHYMRCCSPKQESKVLEDMVLDAKQEKFLFIGTLPSHLDVEVACTKLLGVKNIINFLKQHGCFQHVNPSFGSSWATHDDNFDDDCSIDTKVELNAYGALISLDDANLLKDLCARNFEEKKSMEYVYEKEGNTMADLSVHTDVSWYLDDLWACGPIWDCVNDVNEVVDDASLPTLDCKQDLTCQSDVDESTVDEVGRVDWGFDDPQVEMDEEMQVLVCHALPRVQKLKEASHACVVFEEEFNLENWGSHDDMDILNNLSWIIVTNMYHGEENNTAWSFDSHDMNALCWKPGTSLWKGSGFVIQNLAIVYIQCMQATIVFLLIVERVFGAEAEEARKKKVAAMKARVQHLKDAEDKYSKENMQKIHDKWRKIMRVAKTKELHKDIETFSECYDSEVKQKDGTIASLMKHLLEAEQQRKLAFSKHLEILDQLMSVHQTRMKDMEMEFQDNVQQLETSFEKESEHIRTAHEKQKKELHDMIHAMENECKEAESELRQDFEASREEIKNKNTEEYNVLKISLERSIEDLECKIEETHQAYLESTDSKTQAFKRMMEKDKTTARLIEQRMRKLLHLHESIAYRRSKIATDSREWECRNKAMRDQKDGMNKHYQGLKRKISKLRSQAHQDLKAVSKLSDEVQADLQKKLDMAGTILKLGQLNSKLELEQERVFPFDPLHLSSSVMNMRNFKLNNGLTNLVKGHVQERSRRAVDTTSDTCSSDSHREHKSCIPVVTDKLGKEVEEFDYMSKFHCKYNKVLLDRIVLDKRKKELAADIDKLKFSLKGYVEGFAACNDKTMRKLKLYMLEAGGPLEATSSPSNIDCLMREMRKSTTVSSKQEVVLV
ncbi:hypothetical protein L7F22_033399 [Adiantum nelumboides]|nr:hypothetical protein [Adiantum nelumboides]